MSEGTKRQDAAPELPPGPKGERVRIPSFPHWLAQWQSTEPITRESQVRILRQFRELVSREVRSPGVGRRDPSAARGRSSGSAGGSVRRRLEVRGYRFCSNVPIPSYRVVALVEAATRASGDGQSRRDLKSRSTSKAWRPTARPSETICSCRLQGHSASRSFKYVRCAERSLSPAAM